MKFFAKLTKKVRLVIAACLIRMGRFIPSKLYLKCLTRQLINYSINTKHPKTFNEKLNWLKLYDHNPRYTIMADKYKVKEYVASLIGDEYVLPCYGVWDRYEDIDFSKLPEQFVLKANHDSSGATICKDKSLLDHNALRKRFNKLLKRNYYYGAREWPYKNIERKILAEQLLEDKSSDRLRDYKFWCFNGVPTYMYCTVKGGVVFENFYDMDFNPVNINHGFSRHVPEFSKPTQFEKMKELATILSKGLPFIRVDFYEVEDRLYFGEFTFYDWGGMRAFGDYAQDLELGKLIDLDMLTSAKTDN